jgi:hypothetical protein
MRLDLTTVRVLAAMAVAAAALSSSCGALPWSWVEEKIEMNNQRGMPGQSLELLQMGPRLAFFPAKFDDSECF